ncbi:MAG TPA: peptidoglycan-associated lipoprotein Pal [Holophagaceae bacterium]|nr:peptidoglycan-associated lipoprotein Pal [Holophagaceae bacterium]
MTRTPRFNPLLLTGALVLAATLACKKPEAAPAPAPAKAAPTVDNSAAQAQAKAAEEAKARQVAEEAARRAELAKKAAFDQAAAAALQDVHFDYDKSDIKAEERARLQKIADFLRAYPTAKLQIQGNADERGTAEYNLALGNRRASAALDYLHTLGVEGSRLSLISFGKEKPVCTEAKESCWSQNRRDHFELR